MKKLLTFALSIVIIVSLTACGAVVNLSLIHIYFAAQHGALFVWVRLFWSQESGEGFWREFVTAIGKLSPTVAREMSKFQYPDSFEACSTVVGLLEGLCRDGHLVIVLEDFDRVETQRVDKPVSYTHLLPGMEVKEGEFLLKTDTASQTTLDIQREQFKQQLSACLLYTSRCV